MSFIIKNCGITDAQSLASSMQTGATHVGFMHYSPSPRHLSLVQGALLAEQVREALTLVAVMVAPSTDDLDSVMQAWKPDMIQLHGLEDAGALRALALRAERPLILAGSVREQQDIQRLNALAQKAGAAMLLLDAYAPDAHGGTGCSFDWGWLEYARPELPWLLAGGLTEHNVGDAIRQGRPDGVDVSSGIEYQRGKKSPEKIAAFNQAVLSQAHATETITQHTI